MADAGRGGRGGGAWRFVLAGLVVAGAAGGYLAFRAVNRTNRPVAYQPSTAPVSGPTTEPDTRPATRPKPPTTSFIDVVRAVYPTYTTTRPLDLPVRDLGEAARIVMTDPVYMGPAYRPDLWITRADGAPAAQVLHRAMDPKQDPIQVHVLRETVRFVHWNPGAKLWTPFLVCEGADGAFEVVSPTRRQPLPTSRKYDWARANSWDDKVVVPSPGGVSVFRFDPELKEDYRELLASPDAAQDSPETAPQSLLDYQGLLAWAPAEGGSLGSRGAVRYFEDKWSELGPDQNWPQRILHLVPLRDGSVLRMEADGDGGVKLMLAALFAADVDEAVITAFVEQMSDADADRREAAFKELSQYGPGVYPILEKLAEDQPPEARTRLRQLMREKVQPTLGGLTLLGGTLQTVTRHDDGGAVFYAEAGVSIPRESGPPLRRVPAWIAVRPGRAAEVLDEQFVRELKPDGCEVVARGSEWVVAGDAPGMRRWIGNGFVPLLRKDEQAFSAWLGVDARGRWLFRKPGADEQTLIIDPRLPDPTPRLPFWEYTTANDFGWDHEDWPAVRREGGDWSLREQGWRLLDEEKDEALVTSLPPGAEPAKTPGVDAVATQSRPSGEPPPLLTDRDGTEYFDGLTSLHVRSKDGKEISWPLPPVANGTGTATLLKTPDGILYLFNAPGRVLRIRPTPDGPEPFMIEATFTKRIPSVEKPRRIWMDPAGRIVIADVRRLILFFPDGFIHPRIRDMMPIDRSALE